MPLRGIAEMAYPSGISGNFSQLGDLGSQSEIWVASAISSCVEVEALKNLVGLLDYPIKEELYL
jgi:hypothetical protein